MMSTPMIIEGTEIPFDSEQAKLILKELEQFRQAQMDAAFRRQLAVARHLGTREVSGDKHFSFQVDPTIFHYWGQRLGYECWEDTGKNGFVTELIRDNPEIRVKNERRNPTVSMGGYVPSRVKYRKSFG